MSSNQSDSSMSIGFIGGSLQSAVGYAHYVACQLDGRWKLVSGCFSKNPDSARATAQAWGVSADRCYSDWRLYIAEEKQKVDAVVVLTPTPNHEEMVCALLRAGVPVICEKAMAADLGQSKKIQQALSEAKGFLAVTFNYSGYPMVRVLRRYVQGGKLGKLKQIHIEMPSDGFIQKQENMKPQAWRLKDGEIPTILLDLAVHVHHLNYFVTELKPLSVNADFHHYSIFDDIIDDAYLWVNYENDMRASFWVSKTALGHKNGLKIRLYGEQGSAEWIQEKPEQLTIFSKESVASVYDRSNCSYAEEIRERFKPGHPGGFIEAFANLYNDIADALSSWRQSGEFSSPYVFGWEHADEGLRLLSAAAESNKKRVWVNI